METESLQALFQTAPLTTVVLDTGKHDESGARELELRWRALSEQLGEQGAPQAAIEAIGAEVEELLEGRTPAGLLLVADGERLRLRHELPEPPAQDVTTHARLPHLAEMARQSSRSVSHLLITVDRLGGVIRRYGPWQEELATIGESGEDWPIKKTGIGGWSEARYQRSVENQWEANLKALADDVNRIVQASRPEVVLVAGDIRAKSLLHEHLSAEAAELTRDIEHPGDIEPTPETVREQVLQVAAEKVTDVLDQVRRGLGQGSDAAGGLDAVCQALQRGQADTLVVAEGLLEAERKVWIGETLTEVAVEQSGIADGKGEQVSAIDGLMRAAAGAATAVLVAADPALPEQDCVASLRYADPSTPQ